MSTGNRLLPTTSDQRRSNGGRRRFRDNPGKDGLGQSGKHPPHLQGRDIGLWYAAKHKARQKPKFDKSTVTMNLSIENGILDIISHLETLPIVKKHEHGVKSRSLLSKRITDVRENSEEIDGILLSKSEAVLDSPLYTFRQSLPVYARREELIDMIESNNVCLVSGSTGCGKTTQIPQYVLDHYISNGMGSQCSIVCTQPRRISAISVSERVAKERDEAVGDSCGYLIRLEHQVPRDHGSIIYCTTGILLRWLESDASLNRCSHIFLDEIHERNLLEDFLLVILRDLLSTRPNIHIVLMSATLQADRFSEYFGGCPVMEIPGRTFPVEEFYLEEVLECSGYVPQFLGKVPLWKRKRNKALSDPMRIEFESNMEDYIDEITGKFSMSTIASIKQMDHYTFNRELVFNTIKWICNNKPPGGILVFLPGWNHISKISDLICQDPSMDSSRYLVIPLHSLVPTMNQRLVFERPQDGVRKIVLATTIAETSITIDDIVYVVDSGFSKVSSFDPDRNLASLKCEWTSRSSASQRKGRAGRLQPGLCYHIYSRSRNAVMAEHQLPEILRTPLESLCLNIRLLKLGRIEHFLNKCMDSPVDSAVCLAIKLLTELNAIDCEQNLTPLGYNLAKIPMHPQMGRMIIYGALFRCLDPILTIAASLDFKDPFYIPLGKEKVVDQIRRDVSRGTQSDHIGILFAYLGWEQSRSTGSSRQYCDDYYLSEKTLFMLGDMKRQLCRYLYEGDFVASCDPKQAAFNENSHKTTLVRAILCAGLYPQIAKLQCSQRPPARLFTEDGRVAFHQKSVNAHEVAFASDHVVYHKKVQSDTGISLYDTTVVSPYSLLLFGGDIQVGAHEGREVVCIDHPMSSQYEVSYFCSGRVAYLVKELRGHLVSLLETMMNFPQLEHDSRELILGCIVDFLAIDTRVPGPRSHRTLMV